MKQMGLLLKVVLVFASRDIIMLENPISHVENAIHCVLIVKAIAVDNALNALQSLV